MPIPNYKPTPILGPDAPRPTFPSYSAILVTPLPLCHKLLTRPSDRKLLYMIARLCRLVDTTCSIRERNLNEFKQLCEIKNSLDDSPKIHANIISILVTQRIKGLMEEIDSVEQIIEKCLKGLERCKEKIGNCAKDLEDIVKMIGEHGKESQALVDLMGKYQETIKVFLELGFRLEALFAKDGDPFVGADRMWPGDLEGVVEEKEQDGKVQKEEDDDEGHNGSLEGDDTEKNEQESKVDANKRMGGRDVISPTSQDDDDDEVVVKDSLEDKRGSQDREQRTPVESVKKSINKEKVDDANQSTPVPVKRKLKLPDSARSSRGKPKVDQTVERDNEQHIGMALPPGPMSPDVAHDGPGANTQSPEDNAETLVTSQPPPQRSQAGFSTGLPGPTQNMQSPKQSSG